MITLLNMHRKKEAKIGQRYLATGGSAGIGTYVRAVGVTPFACEVEYMDMDFVRRNITVGTEFSARNMTSMEDFTLVMG